MKRALLFLLIILGSTFIKSRAQSIPNNGFEILNPNNTLGNWGNVYLMPISIDSMGNTIQDSVVFDGLYYYGPTSDANNGNTALELRNAWNFTTDTGIAGAVGADEDSVFSAWGIFNMVPTYATQFNLFEPFNFGFYYKFFPVNGDSAYAEIALWDSVGVQVGGGLLIISNATPVYTLATAPIYYFFNGTAAFYSLSIHNFLTSDPGSHQPGFGTRLLVDDIGFNYVSSSDNEIENDALSIFPNPVSDQLHIRLHSQNKFETEIINSIGETVLKKQTGNNFEVSGFAKGIYFVKVNDGETILIRKFIKQ